MSDHTFLDLPELLHHDDLLVVNETRVRAARLLGTRRETGGTVELLLLERLEDGSWEALAKPARRLRRGVVIEFEGFEATILGEPDEGKVRVSLSAADEEQAVSRAGAIPLPPYFTGSLPHPDRYQTIFASAPGSAAAPTAGLHFTPQVLERTRDRGIDIATVDLHVSLDTFRPIAVAEIEDHRMHSEWCHVPESTADAIGRARSRNGRVVAVGTTVARTLESMSDGAGRVSAGEKRTDLFLKPGSRFDVVDALITNFHMPGSTLLVLLAGFMGGRWREAYEIALEHGYRFLSFGDSMFAERLDPG
jgi:S-adenosylmethionine:tRNA ribosyltransferase-isomerase